MSLCRLTTTRRKRGTQRFIVLGLFPCSPLCTPSFHSTTPPRSRPPCPRPLRSLGRSSKGSSTTPPITPKCYAASPSLLAIFNHAVPFSSSDVSLAGSRTGINFLLYVPSCRRSLTSYRVSSRSRYLPTNSPLIPCFAHSLTSPISNSQVVVVRGCKSIIMFLS